MENLAFACISDVTDIKTLFFVASIRANAGAYSDNPVYIVVPKSEKKFPKNYTRKLLKMDAKILAFTPDPDLKSFPFAEFVQAAVTAESFAKENKQILAWLTTDTLVLNEPTEFLLQSEKTLGYRPVHHTLIGSKYDEPIDSFWRLVYEKCGVTEEDTFPMQTHIDGNILRPYFNAGCLIIKPTWDLFHLWLTKFKEIYQHPKIGEYYEKDPMYKIFIHQAVLSAVIMSLLKKETLHELSFNYNYPLHLYSESLKEYHPQDFNTLVTARYEELDVWDTIPFQDPIKSWFKDKKREFMS